MSLKTVIIIKNRKGVRNYHSQKVPKGIHDQLLCGLLDGTLN
jgi:hypothetical protein